MRRFAVVITFFVSLAASAESRRRAVGSPSFPALDTPTLYSLSFIEHNPVSLEPGDSHRFALGVLKCCVFFEPVRANVVWSVEPHFSHASIDSRGLLTVGDDAPNGAVYRVYANVDDRRIISVDAHVYTPEANPLVAIRYFRQIGELSCDGSSRIDPARATPIQQMLVHADGSFDVTWIPFEIYKDYWGFFSARQNRITFGIRRGNHVPQDFDGDGTYELVKAGEPEALSDGETRQRYHLFLRGIWLGSRSGEQVAPACGVVLEGWL